MFKNIFQNLTGQAQEILGNLTENIPEQIQNVAGGITDGPQTPVEQHIAASKISIFFIIVPFLN